MPEAPASPVPEPKQAEEAPPAKPEKAARRPRKPKQSPVKYGPFHDWIVNAIFQLKKRGATSLHGEKRAQHTRHAGAPFTPCPLVVRAHWPCSA